MSAPQRTNDHAPYPTGVSSAGLPNSNPTFGIPVAAPYVAGDSTRVSGAPAPPPGTGAQSATWQQPAAPAGETFHSNVAAGGAPPAAGGQSAYVQTQPVKGNLFDKFVTHSKIALNQAEDVARKAAGHVSAGGTTGSSLSTVWGKLESGAKQLMKGGQEPFWRDIFHPAPSETLLGVYATHFSTERGPVAGNLFLSSENAAFCSDRALEYQAAPGAVQKAYYKLILPLDKIANVETLPNPQRPKDQYVKISTTDNHEFWFLAFFDLTRAVEAVQVAVTSARSRQYTSGSSGMPSTGTTATGVPASSVPPTSHV
ncbi:GRAM domain containing protein [Klebsormidium nitens]|uniref:GRAM domain containing protein n=1 Tax=Klebsormidium nitens TaxID=105231 RepID=A0A1Y1I7N4_KLENI|nr:GRAM domain containing protein [Klebsormidium nitens]|eukprot:GAQ85439.1 GRAM domain containing protein [Klebsormidium nitens]